MIFQEVGPNENLDVSRFSSAPFGLWEAGILKMGWGKARVRANASKDSAARIGGFPSPSKETNPTAQAGLEILLWR